MSNSTSSKNVSNWRGVPSNEFGRVQHLIWYTLRKRIRSIISSGVTSKIWRRFWKRKSLNSAETLQPCFETKWRFQVCPSSLGSIEQGARKKINLGAGGVAQKSHQRLKTHRVKVRAALTIQRFINVGEHSSIYPLRIQKREPIIQPTQSATLLDHMNLKTSGQITTIHTTAL